jgi:glycosyltransferase involved in cell wall biosynthesis
MRQQEMRRLLARINAVVAVDAWLVPTLFWPEAAAIRARKVVVVPDLVMLESPLHYAEHASIQTFDQLCTTIACADHLVCYSEHVKRAHLVRRFGIDPARVSVIEHAPVDSRATFGDTLQAGLPLAQAAALLLQRYLATHLPRGGLLRGVDLTHVPFVFYASQVRPHKNLLTLVRAYEQLLRRDLVSVKLVLTADFNAPEAERLRHYVWAHRLQYDVISLPRLPAPVLSAMFALARLAVCPTLFEGGLPFTFSEALSVGTPVVMSRIPVVTEKIPDGPLARAMLFDPYDEADVCARMRWALAHRDELLALQQPLYEALAARSWEDVASDYLAVMAPGGMAKAA